MTGSILTEVKKVLGLDESYTAFDPDIIMHINTAFSTLNQLGVGPDDGFMIEDGTPTWDTFLGVDFSPKFNQIKTYVYLRVRQLFDPPSTGYLVEATQKQLDELTWRISTEREERIWELSTQSQA